MRYLSNLYWTNRLPQIDEIKFGKIVARGFPFWILRAAPLEEGVGQSTTAAAVGGTHSSHMQGRSVS